MDPMEEIWNDVAKTDDQGNRYIDFKGVNDLSYLYVTGFVDDKKYTFKEWTDSFLPSRQKDGSYIVTHEQWLEKRKFRYSGKIGAPFDPFALEEREYREDEFLKLLTDKVLPNTIFDKNAIPQIMSNLKLRKKLHDGKVTLDKEVKEGLKMLIDQFSSSTRFLEVMVDQMRKAKKGKIPTSPLEAQTSSFAAGKTAQEVAAARLAEIAKELKGAAPAVSEAPSISLKELKKKKRDLKA